MQTESENRVKVGFISLGCAKNTVDSERMLAEIVEGGFVLTARPEEADVVIINTCGFIEPAVAESLQAIREAVGWKRAGAVKKVIVAGCLSQRFGDQLFDEVEGVDAVVGLGQRDSIAEVIETTLSSREHISCFGPVEGPVHDDRGRVLIGPGHRAYLRISEGCSHRCAFCTIPSIRGRFRSKEPQKVVSEATELADAGVVELNIIGQDVTWYGRDIGMREGLAELLEQLGQIDKIRWIRLLYLYPTGVTDRLVQTIRRSDKLVHYLDIPIQHIADEVLQAMGRGYRGEDVKRLIGRLREAMPDVVLRTTLIVGFPGETDRHFEQLLKFIRWARFDALGCFEYYAEPGTRAARMPGQVPQQIRRQRREAVMLTQQPIAFARNTERVGANLQCLVEQLQGHNKATGRFYGQAPEVDGLCLIEQCAAEPGDFVDVEVVGTAGYDLIVRQI